MSSSVWSTRPLRADDEWHHLYDGFARQKSTARGQSKTRDQPHQPPQHVIRERSQVVERKSPPKSEAMRSDARNAVRWIAFISKQPAISRTERKYSVWRH
jgi:hypothetical protein